MENHSELFKALTCFLGHTEREVDNMMFWGAPLQKGGRQRLDDTMTGVSYNTASDPMTGFVMIFDTDFGGTAVIQTTTWGDETKEMYDQIYREEYCGIKTAVSDGFIVPSEQFDGLLIEMQEVSGMDFIAVNIEGTY